MASRTTQDDFEPAVQSAQAAHRRGVLLASEHQRGRDGLEYFRLAHDLEPGNPVFAADLALSLREAGDVEGARQVARRMAEGLRSCRFMQLEGNELHRAGLVFDTVLSQPEQALVCFSRACTLAPGNPELELCRAISLSRSGHDQEALFLASEVARSLEQREALTSEQACQLARAAHLLCREEPARAHALVRRAFDAAPGHPGILRPAGVIALENNDPQEAVTFFRKATEIDPDDEQVWGGLQYSLFRLGLFEDSFRLGQDILGRWPESFEARFNMAAAAINLGWFQEAEQGLSELLLRSPEDGLAHAAMGICCAACGRAQEAREHQRRALELDGSDPEVQKLSAEIDRLLDQGGGPAPEVLGSMLLAMIGAVLTRSRHGSGR